MGFKGVFIARTCFSDVIARAKAFGGIQYNAFTMLYESMVFPVISYGDAIWATQFFLNAFMPFRTEQRDTFLMLEDIPKTQQYLGILVGRQLQQNVGNQF